MKAVDDDLHGIGVRNVVIPRKGKPWAARRAEEHRPAFRRTVGSITKTGNTHVRRLLVEAAWHHRSRYRVGKTMRDRWELVAMKATDACTSDG